jgi:uncharacterized membrane protein YhaH (DUF805 family)
MWDKVKDTGWYKFSRYILCYHLRFKGRATRREFLLVFIFFFVGGGFLADFLNELQPNMTNEVLPTLSGILYLYLMIAPVWCALIRRLHDSGRDSHIFWIVFIPYFGVIGIMLYLMLDPDEGENDYGPNPRDKRKSL